MAASATLPLPTAKPVGLLPRLQQIPSSHTNKGVLSSQISSKLQMGSAASSTLWSPSMEDALKILKPAQKKLSSVGAQRVMTVVTEMISKLEKAIALPYLAQSIDRYSVSLGAEVASLVGDYNKLCEDYNMLYKTLEANGVQPDLIRRSRGSQRTLSQASISSGPVRLEPLHRIDESSVEEQFSSVQAEFRHTCKSLIRALSGNVATEMVLKGASEELSPQKEKFIQSTKELRDIMQEKLLTTKAEDVKRTTHLDRVLQELVTAENKIEELEAVLSAEKKKKNEEVSVRKKNIERVKSDIRTQERVTNDSQRRLKEDAARQQSQAQQTFTNKKTKLLEEIVTVSKSLQEARTANKEKEQSLRKRAYKRETEVENWIHKYDNDVGGQQEELEELDKEFTEEKKQLKELEERLGILTIEYDVAKKEIEEARQKAEEESKRLALMNRAATTLQVSWRAYLRRRGPRKGKGKGKGKGKRGKKGKKGKKGGKKK